ncbi:MAG: glycoside hydrolase, partial [Sphingobacteriales bacterium]|nr:glycoside hydrolase [Sphingobacteriales bacterium]
GEGIQRPDLSVGDGVYKSTDGGQTWINTGLHDAQQIGGLAVDVFDPNRVFAAVLGHPYGPNKERGVYRTLDGGKTWNKILYIDENTGAIQVAIDPNDPKIIYADMWAGRQGPWENGSWNGKESGLYKSSDGGTTWKKLTKGLPTTEQGLGRIGFSIAPSNSLRLYATVDAGKYGGIYRSDDGGENWYMANADGRFWGRGSDFAEVKVDPKNADVVYSANVVTWKSVDGGKTWNAFRGAPGGDDYHRIWINPNDPNIILIASDQGAIVTVNGGETFSSWYNQPTAQFYHVATDNAFPYNVFSGQQESGSASVASRSNNGQITYRDWAPVGVEEYGYIIADPNEPNILFGGKITKTDKRTGQVQNILPEPVRSGNYRFLRTAPIIFSPVDKKTLYFAGNVLFKTMDRGNSWQVISPDLTRESWDIPASVGIYTSDELKKMPRRGVIYTIAPSYKDINTIWVGTDDGFIQVTKDGGKTWKNVTPPQVTSWSKVSLMDASHTDVNTAYAAVNRIRCDDMKPHIYKTTDGGKTWKEIINGLPDDPINVVKEDPVRKGLLFAGSEKAVYVSFDDGEHWQSLRLTMPPTSIRDLVIKDDDLVLGTHGRGFWILDDITPLRQITSETAKQSTILYKPQTATRVRWSIYPDTPLPQEEPAGENPPDGAVIDYYIAEDAKDIQLDIIENNDVLIETDIHTGSKHYSKENKVIRTYSSNDTMYNVPDVNIPLYWIRQQQILSAEKGHHRFLWDMKYAPLNVPPSYPISAIYKNTAPEQTSPWALPGTYTAKLTVNGKTYSQSFNVRMDPRVKTPVKDLIVQHDLALYAYNSRKECRKALNDIAGIKAQIKSLLPVAGNDFTPLLNKLDEELSALENTPGGSKNPSFGKFENNFTGVFSILQDNDNTSTTQAVTAVAKLKKEFADFLHNWTDMKDKHISELNRKLQSSGLTPVKTK